MNLKQLTIILSLIFLLMFCIDFVNSADWTPQGDINLRDTYQIKNAKNITAENVTISYLCNSTGCYTITELLYYDKSSGNWSADKGDYWNVSEDLITSKNLTLANLTSDYLCNSTSCYTITSLLSSGSYENGSGISLVGTQFNHSDTSSQSSETNVVNSYIQNITLDAFGHLTNIASAAIDFSAYATIVYVDTALIGYATESYVNGLIASIGNWTLDKINYYTKTESNNKFYYSADNETDPHWTGNQSNYFTSAQVITYINANDTTVNDSMRVYVDSLNHDGILWSDAVNGTLLSQADWDTNYTSNDAAWRLNTDTWADNFTSYFTSATTIAYINANDTTVNASMKLYVDAQDLDYNNTQTAYTDSKLDTTYYNASAIQVITGTGAGAIGDLQTYNEISYNVSEVDSDFDLRVNFTGVVGVNQLIFRYKSAVVEPHIMNVQIWNYDTGAWESYAEEGARSDYGIFTYGVYDADEHISGGVVQVRFYTTNGPPNNAHTWQFDWVTVSSGAATPSSSESDPFAVHRDGTTPLTANWDQGAFNLTNTDSWFLGKTNGSQVSNFFNWLNKTSADLLYAAIGTTGFTTDQNAELNTTGGPTFENMSVKAIYGNGDADTYLNWTGASGDQLELFAGGISFIHLIEGEGDGLVFNQDSNDIDFRVESDDDTYALAVDGGTNKVRMGNYSSCDMMSTDADGILSCEVGTYRLESWDNFTGIPHATPSDGDTTHFSWADEIYDWAVGLFMQDLHDDTTPQLGGYLDTDGENIGATDDEIENVYVGTDNCIHFGDGQEASMCFNGTGLITQVN